jgi:hypothetical protein
MNIRTSYVEDLGGVEVHLQWDPEILEVMDAIPAEEGVQILPGDLFEGHNTFRPPNGNSVDNGEGQLVYVVSLVEGRSGVSGEWSVAVATFRAKGKGATSLTFYGDTLMANASIGNILSDAVGGRVHVAEPTHTPSPTATPTRVETIPEPTVPEPTTEPSLTSTPMLGYLYVPLVTKNP